MFKGETSIGEASNLCKCRWSRVRGDLVEECPPGDARRAKDESVRHYSFVKPELSVEMKEQQGALWNTEVE